MTTADRWPASQIERRALASLKLAKNNARTHSPEQIEQIAASIEEWGWTTPVLIDESDKIIAGHGRVEAAKGLGIEEVPVVVARGWTAQQKRAYMLADNQLTLNSDWDRDLLRFKRWHHYVDYTPFKRQKLIRRDDIAIPEAANEYGMRLVQLAEEAA